jgi:hypothetical protein
MNKNEHATIWKPKNNSMCHIWRFDMLPLFLHFKDTTSNQTLKKLANTNCYN